jgi:purine catabolism regulator
MLPTLADVLRLDPVRRGDPHVVAGADRLDARVRWVHVAEVPEVAHLLRGGELVLATGIGLPDEASRLRTYVAELAGVGASGLMVELGYRYADRLPAALVNAAEEHGLPVVALARETVFVDITEAVHARIIDVQLAELRVSEKLHEIFTQLSVDGASPDEVVHQVAAISGRPVVLENLSHQVLAADTAGTEAGELLSTWETRSRAVRPQERTAYDETSGWLLTTVGARGEDWGRLIITGGSPSPRDTVLIERAATTLALGRLLDRHAESLERQAHGTIITGILAHAYADPQEAAARARALGVPLSGRRLLGVVVRPHSGDAVLFRPPDEGPPPTAPPERITELAEGTAVACREAGLPALVSGLDEGAPKARVGVLASLPVRADAESTLTAVATRLRVLCGDDVVMAAGSVVESIRDVRRSFIEAEQVADVAARGSGERLFYRLPDLRLRGLLHLLRDDTRLQTFVERELGPLLEYDAQRDGDLTRILTLYLETGRNKALAAQRAHLSRPALYERLRRIERVLSADLDDVESCASLHVALLALDSVRRSGLQRAGVFCAVDGRVDRAEPEFGADPRGVGDGLPGVVERPVRRVRSDLLAVEAVQFPCGDRGVVCHVVRTPVHALGAQCADQRLADVGVVDELQLLVRRPTAGPHHRLGKVRVPFAVHEGQPQHAQPEPVAVVHLAQRLLRRHLARRVGALGTRFVVLVRGTTPARAVHQSGRREDESGDAGGQAFAGQCDRGVAVDGSDLLVGHVAERGRDVHDRVHAAERLPYVVDVTKIPGDDFGALLVMSLGLCHVPHQDPYILSLVQQPRYEAAAHPAGRSGNEHSHDGPSLQVISDIIISRETTIRTLVG